MDARELRKEAEKMHIRAQSARTDAGMADVSARGHQDRGDADRASVEFSHKDDLFRSADEYDRQAESLEAQALEKERQAIEIERQQESVRSDMQKRLDELEKQKQRLRGGIIGLF